MDSSASFRSRFWRNRGWYRPVPVRIGGSLDRAEVLALLDAQFGVQRQRGHAQDAVHGRIDGEEVIQCNIRDITDRKQAEQLLKESEERFFKAFHLSPVGMIIANLTEKRWAEVNESLLNLLEYTEKEIIGRTSAELQLYENPDDRKRVWNDISKTGSLKIMK